MQESISVKGVPRRACMDEWTAEERKIFDLVQEVEKLGAHPLLTDVVILLGQAKDKLSDWIESEREYFQAEIVGKDGNLTGLTVDEKGCLVCVGTGLKFANQTECLDFISKRQNPERYKVTGHIDCLDLRAKG